jgi:Protein of unknown function (DUF2889)
VLNTGVMPNPSLLPDDADLELIHTRRYEARVYRVDDATLLVRAAVSDTKPPGLYVEGDPEPIEIHQMQVELTVAREGLVIRSARVVFETHPHAACPFISDAYRKLEGLSISRGFNVKLRELFGGAQGCTHTNALLQALAPAVVQSVWSLSVRDSRARGVAHGQPDAGERERRIAGNRNTCHVWADGGEHIDRLRRGDTSEFPPLPVKKRLRALGRDEGKW